VTEPCFINDSSVLPFGGSDKSLDINEFSFFSGDEGLTGPEMSDSVASRVTNFFSIKDNRFPGVSDEGNTSILSVRTLD